MLQIRLMVGSAVNGSMTAVVGSGITSMSEAWMGCQPRIDEPSKPSPSSNTSSTSSLGVSLLPAEPFHLAHGDALHPDRGEALLHLVELERLDDRLDLLHG